MNLDRGPLELNLRSADEDRSFKNCDLQGIRDLVYSEILPKTRGGRLLCSPRDPQLEASRWLLRHPIQHDVNCVILLGLGAGFQLLELLRHRSDLKIIVFEADTEITNAIEKASKNSLEKSIEKSREKNLKISPQVQVLPLNFETLSNTAGEMSEQFKNKVGRMFNYQVLSFRPAWALKEHIYLDAYLYLTGRSQTHLKGQQQKLQHHEGAQNLWSLLLELIH